MKYALTHSLTHFPRHCCAGHGLGEGFLYVAMSNDEVAEVQIVWKVRNCFFDESWTIDGDTECTKLEIVQLRRAREKSAECRLRPSRRAPHPKDKGARPSRCYVIRWHVSSPSLCPNLVMAAEVKLVNPGSTGVQERDISAFIRSPFVPPILD